MKLQINNESKLNSSITVETIFKLSLPNTSPIYIDYLKMIEIRLLLIASLSNNEYLKKTFTRGLFVNTYTQSVIDEKSFFEVQTDKVSLFFDGLNQIVTIGTPSGERVEFTYEELYLYASETGSCKGAPDFNLFDVDLGEQQENIDWVIPNTNIVLRKRRNYLGFFDVENNVPSCPTRIYFPHHYKKETKYPWSSTDTPPEWLESETGSGCRDLSDNNIRNNRESFISYLFK